VKRVINSCFVCERFEGKSDNAPQVPPLHFSRIGADFAGPLFCNKSKEKTTKVYLVLYTC